MQIPRPYLIKKFNIGNEYPVSALIMWAPSKETALSYGGLVFNRNCPTQPNQVFTAVEANDQDQMRHADRTYHGHVQVKGMVG